MTAFREQGTAQLARNLAPDLARLQVDGKRVLSGAEDAKAALLRVVIGRAEQEREER